MSEPTLPQSTERASGEERAFVRVIVRRPMRMRYWLHALLLVATLLTTLIVGARFQYYFLRGLQPFSIDAGELSEFPIFWALGHPRNLLLGIPFSLTLLAILAAHEMGHYLYCRRYGVLATLPFFIPAPTLIGTFGAVIRIKSHIPSRRALFDIGIAGPIAGFVLAVPLMLAGLTWSKPSTVPPAGEAFALGFPLLFRLADCLHLAPVSVHQLLLHPIAIAAWFGLFATALNLLPGGQLDGGHILWSVFPRAHRWASLALVAALVPLAAYCFGGWLILALFVRFSIRHPQLADVPDLDLKRKLLAVGGILMFALTFTPAPFSGFSFNEFFHFR